MAETITIGTVTFVVAPEEAKPALKPKPKRARRRASAPQCAASRDDCLTSSPVRCSDGYCRMNYLAAEFEREKKTKWWQRL